MHVPLLHGANSSIIYNFRDMYSFFGIIEYSRKSDNEPGLNILRQKFPTAFGTAVTVENQRMQLMGDLVCSAHANGSNLYLCGELYGSDAPLFRTVQQLHERINQIGLSAATAELNGRFMLCYLEAGGQTAHLLTDHLAIQQVFVHRGEDLLLFASELRFLLQHPGCPKKIDWKNALRRSIPFEVLDGERNYSAWFEDIEMLEEASGIRLDVRSGILDKFTYWQPYAQQPSSNYRNAAEVEDAYMELLEDAVRLRTQESGPAYSFLSGGLDSSILCALAAKEKPVESFSIITQTTLLEETSALCSQLAKDLGIRNKQFTVPLHRLSSDSNLWKKRVWRAESPFAHNDSMTKTLLHDAIRRLHPDIGYTLTGTGSDQFNGGLARWIIEDAETPEASWAHMMDKIREAERRQILPERLHSLWGARRFLQPDFMASWSGRSPEKNPWLYYVKSNIHINHFVLIWDENRAGYSHRHSVRYPFMDPRFLPFFAQIPQEFHSELFFDKQILRRPAARHLPGYILNKPKSPAFLGRYDRRFEFYQSLINPGKLDLLEEALGPVQDAHPVIDKKALVAELNRLIEKPDHKAWQYLLNVINLGLMEKLHEQDENTMNYEDEVQNMMEAVSHLDRSATDRLRKQFDIDPEETLLARPLHFLEGCSLVTEHGSGRVFIQKNEILSYEIDENELLWSSFLFALDGTKSAKEILDTLSGDFESIREYFYLCINDGILGFET